MPRGAPSASKSTTSPTSARGEWWTLWSGRRGSEWYAASGRPHRKVSSRYGRAMTVSLPPTRGRLTRGRRRARASRGRARRRHPSGPRRGGTRPPIARAARRGAGRARPRASCGGHLRETAVHHALEEVGAPLEFPVPPRGPRATRDPCSVRGEADNRRPPAPWPRDRRDGTRTAAVGAARLGRADPGAFPRGLRTLVTRFGEESSVVGARGFEPPTSCTPSKRAIQAAPRPDRGAGRGSSGPDARGGRGRTRRGPPGDTASARE